MRMMSRRLAILAAIGSLALNACASSGDSPLPNWPVQPETLPAAAGPVASGFGQATWALDPAFPAPTADATSLHVLVWEVACSSGHPTTGRMSAPAITITPTTVTITIGVRPLSGMQTCPGPPGTPAILTLPEALGSRTLLDGGTTPPAPPSPRFGVVGRAMTCEPTSDGPYPGDSTECQPIAP